MTDRDAMAAALTPDWEPMTPYPSDIAALLDDAIRTDADRILVALEAAGWRLYPDGAGDGLRSAAVRLREAAVKAGAHIVVTTDYPDGVKAFGILCDAIDVMDAALEATPASDSLDVLLDGIRDEVREAVLEGDAQDCSSADCIADAVYEIVRVRLRAAPAPPSDSLERRAFAAGFLAGYDSEAIESEAWQKYIAAAPRSET